MKPKPAGVIAVAAAAAAAIAAPALTTAQTPAATTVTFQETRPKIAFDDIAPKSKNRVSQGDRLVTSGPLYDISKKRRGTIYTSCTAVGATKPVFAVTLLCTATYKVAAGQIVAAGLFKLDGSGELPIVGGSGAYSGAHGTVTSGKPAQGFEDADVITISG